MTYSIRDLLASALGELPPDQRPQIQPLAPIQPVSATAGPWRVTAQVYGGKVQISNNHESRVVPKVQLETYLRGHGPAALPSAPIGVTRPGR
jgi:hypothetical protein